MAKTLMIKTLAVAAFVCLLVDLSRAASVEQQQQQPAQGSESLDGAKQKVSDFMDSIKKTATQALDRVQQSDNTKKIESSLTSFFSSTMDKLKSTFTSSKVVNADDKNKQEAIKAFDEYAEKHKNN